MCKILGERPGLCDDIVNGLDGPACGAHWLRAADESGRRAIGRAGRRIAIDRKGVRTKPRRLNRT